MLFYKLFFIFKTVAAIKDGQIIFSQKYLFFRKLIVDDGICDGKVHVGAHNFELKYLKF